jgi:serine-type D-Ala-D-Ala carboxypeptidase/endopeptidase
MFKILLTFFILLVTTQASTQKNFDHYINERAGIYMKAKQHVGLSIGIIQDNILHTYHYGSVSKAYKLLPTDTSIYEIGSVTKTFTALLLAHAVIENKISLQDDVRKYLDTSYTKWISNKDTIKIIHLANHTSGLPKNVPAFKTANPLDIIRQFKDFSEDKFLRSLNMIKLNDEPGKHYSYSNADVQLLGIILEKVYNMSYADLLENYITRPYKMTDTRLTISAKDYARIVTGYDSADKAMPQADMWKAIPEAGYLKSTTIDLLKYLQANMNMKNDTVMLAQQTSFTHTDEGDNNIGLYWFIHKRPYGYTQVSHAGGTFGCTSYCLMIPELKIGIVCLTNDAVPGTEHALKDLADDLVSRLIDKNK